MFLAALTLAVCAAGALILGLGAAVSAETPRDCPHEPGFL